MALFRLLHISDFHFCTPPEGWSWKESFRKLPALAWLFVKNLRDFPLSYSEDIADGAARFVLEKKGEFDLAVVSGDLAHMGEKEYLRVAHSFVDSTAALAQYNVERRPTLRAGLTSIALLPGNHDRFQDVFGTPGCKEFDEVFKSYWPQDDAREVAPHATARHAIFEKDGEKLAVIFADFCLRQAADAEGIVLLNKWGRGRAYEDVIQDLTHVTSSVRQKHSSVAVIWVMHFPPVSQSPPLHKVVDFHLIEDAAKANSISLMMAGHLHRRDVYHIKHGTPVLCAGSLTSHSRDRLNWMHSVEIEISEGGIARCNKSDWHWNVLRGNFLRYSSNEIATVQ
ncbi:unnamed protein product [Phaeothamnion confervicola]